MIDIDVSAWVQRTAAMARKLRLEYEDALYHVLNRGNYRADIFATQRAKAAFEGCLFEACEKAGWRLHAYVIMRNHYHLALETPGANLVAGMKWLQATFSNRFNRMRKERGHVFQGRYQAIVLEDGVLGAVCHYIHLNPVRVRAIAIGNLGSYRHGSFHWLNQPRKRPVGLDFSTALDAAGGLKDTPAGRRSYHRYLAHLAADKAGQATLGFETMCRGWAHGSRDFKRTLLQEHKQTKRQRGAIEAEATEMRELAWEDLVQRALRRLRKQESHLVSDRKSAPWKVAIATHLKKTTTATNPWLARRLHMGHPDGVSRYSAECRSGRRGDAEAALAKIANIRV